MDNKIYQIALTMIPGLGSRSQRQLLSMSVGPEQLFQMDKSGLKEIFGSHTSIIDAIFNKTMMNRAEKELDFCIRNGIKPLFYSDKEYPQRMNHAACVDTPVLIYQQGSCDLNPEKSIAIVGTRRATENGKIITHRIVEELCAEGVTIVSGLAYGIDTASHKASVEMHLPTVGVLGHGLDQLYPHQNQGLARTMLQNGALVTEYPSYTKIMPGFFPARNRIIAAMSDAVIVVEASEKGGALITAGIADSYHRDVFAVPGRITDTYSKGCNNLIANNKALLLRNCKDLFYSMGWEKKNEGIQTQMFVELNADERPIYDMLKASEGMTIDEIAANTTTSIHKIAATLLNLELSNLIICLPGKIYKAC